MKKIGDIQKVIATSQQHLDRVKNLIRDFVKWHLQRQS